MLGHKCKFTQTNAMGFIAVCECGWYGTVVHLPAMALGSDNRRLIRERHACDMAELQHRVHLDDERQAIAKQHEAALVSHGKFIETARPVVTRIGRWGRG